MILTFMVKVIGANALLSLYVQTTCCNILIWTCTSHKINHGKQNVTLSFEIKYQDHSTNKNLNYEISLTTIVGSFDFDIYTHIMSHGEQIRV